jgi:HAE1 family hydrophobic/amphiphilic exporter-1
VVDDAIVVVENVERHLAEGLSPVEAARVTMDEVGSALIAIALVLSAVFIPTAFVSGITGQFYRQFAVTIATATVISAFVSLTLSPACRRCIRRSLHRSTAAVGEIVAWPMHGFSAANYVFGALEQGYAAWCATSSALPSHAGALRR